MHFSSFIFAPIKRPSLQAVLSIWYKIKFILVVQLNLLFSKKKTCVWLCACIFCNIQKYGENVKTYAQIKWKKKQKKIKIMVSLTCKIIKCFSCGWIKLRKIQRYFYLPSGLLVYTFLDLIILIRKLIILCDMMGVSHAVKDLMLTFVTILWMTPTGKHLIQWYESHYTYLYLCNQHFFLYIFNCLRWLNTAK